MLGVLELIVNIVIRVATRPDAANITALTRAMMVEMANHGGNAVSLRDADWEAFTDQVKAQVEHRNHKFLIAESVLGQRVGFVGGELRDLSPPLAEKRILHLSFVYVVPNARRNGIARSLLVKLLQWGRESGCSEADLNVDDRNSAIGLYHELGFTGFRRNLRCPI